jgi:hypothetical protein
VTIKTQRELMIDRAGRAHRPDAGHRSARRTDGSALGTLEPPQPLGPHTSPSGLAQLQRLAGNRAVCSLLDTGTVRPADRPVVQRVQYFDGAIGGQPFKDVHMDRIEIATGDNADDRCRGLYSGGASGCAIIFIRKAPNELSVAHCVASSSNATTGAEGLVEGWLRQAIKIVLVYGTEYSTASQRHLAAELIQRAGRQADEVHVGYGGAAMRPNGQMILDPDFKDVVVEEKAKKKCVIQ